MAFDFSYLEGLEVNLAPDVIGWKVVSGISALRLGTVLRIEPTPDPSKQDLIVVEIGDKRFMGEWRPRKRLDWLELRDARDVSFRARIKLRKGDPFTILGVIHVESEPTETETEIEPRLRTPTINTEAEAAASAALRALGIERPGFDVLEDAQPEAEIEWPEFLEDPNDETPFAYWSEIDLPATKSKHSRPATTTKRKTRANATGLESA